MFVWSLLLCLDCDRYVPVLVWLVLLWLRLRASLRLSMVTSHLTTVICLENHATSKHVFDVSPIVRVGQRNLDPQPCNSAGKCEYSSFCWIGFAYSFDSYESHRLGIKQQDLLWCVSVLEHRTCWTGNKHGMFRRTVESHSEDETASRGKLIKRKKSQSNHWKTENKTTLLQGSPQIHRLFLVIVYYIIVKTASGGSNQHSSPDSRILFVLVCITNTLEVKLAEDSVFLKKNKTLKTHTQKKKNRKNKNKVTKTYRLEDSVFLRHLLCLGVDLACLRGRTAILLRGGLEMVLAGYLRGVPRLPRRGEKRYRRREAGRGFEVQLIFLVLLVGFWGATPCFLGFGRVLRCDSLFVAGVLLGIWGASPVLWCKATPPWSCFEVGLSFFKLWPDSEKR